MAQSTKSPATAQAGDNSESLADIGIKLRKLRDIFESGDLLSRARKRCKQSEWLPWLETYFDASDDTALNHIKAYKLSLESRTIRDLRVPPTTIYRLAREFEEGKKKQVEARIKALAEFTKDKVETISVEDAHTVIKGVNAALRLEGLRSEWGNHHVATLEVLDNLDPDVEWHKRAIKALRKENPETEEAANKILFDVHYEFVAKLYAKHGVLPKNLDENSFDDLEGVEENTRARVLEKLLNSKQPIDDVLVNHIVYSDDDDEREQGDDAEEEEGDEEQKDPPPTPASILTPPAAPETTPPPAEPKPRIEETTVKDKERNDIGADSKAEMKRLKESNDELARKLAVAEQSKKAAYGKIDELEDQLKAAKGDEPKGGVDRLADALIGALKKVAGEKSIEVVDRLIADLKIDPKKLSTENKKAA